MIRPSAAAVVAAVLAVGACGVETAERAERLAPEAVPYDLLDPGADAVIREPRGQVVRLCLLDGDQLRPVERRVEQPSTLTGVARALAEVTGDEAAAGLRTSIGAQEEIVSISRSAGVATVDLSDGASQRLTADPLATVAQLVCTLTAQRGVGLVRFTVADDPIEVPRADGTLAQAPVSEDDYAPMYAPG